MVVVNTVEELRSRLGEELGVSGWHAVNERDIGWFVEMPGDRQWIYTLALLPMLMGEVLSLQGFGFVINYGLNKVRFPAPLPVGERVRLRLSLEAITTRPGSSDITLLSSLECPSQEKPVCVAESVVRVFELRS
jgi:acyl dehydratase